MTMTTTLKMDNITAFQHLSNFESLKDFNTNLEQILLDCKAAFTKSQLVALKQLARFAAKVKGVATARISKLVSATFANDNMGISRRTFERAINLAKDLGILTVHNGKRENGSQTSNIYVFNRYETVKNHLQMQAQQALENDRIVSETHTNDAPKTRKLTHLKAFNLLKPLRKNKKKNIYNDDINISFDAVKKDRIKTYALLQNYDANEWQLKLYNQIMESPFPTKIHESAGVLALITGTNCDAKKMIKAYQIVNSIAINVNNGVQIDNVKAAFRERLDMPVSRFKDAEVQNSIQTQEQRTVKRVPFYDWLRIRE